MTVDLELSDLEIVQMLAAQQVVLNHRDELDGEYKRQVAEMANKYDVEVPDHYDL